YKAKFAAEQILARTKVSYSIARATQFHQLIDAGLGAPVFPVTANMCFQTIYPAEFAVRLCDLAESRVPGPPRTSTVRISCPFETCGRSGSGRLAGQLS